jgi:amino acid transporter
MQETIDLTLKIIRFSSVAFIIFAAIGIVIFIATKDKDRLYKNYKLIMPMYYMFFAITAFCGIILLAFNFFAISLKIIFMIVAFAVILTTSIKSYKFSKNKELFEKFRSFTCKKYVSDIAICLVVFLSVNFLG